MVMEKCRLKGFLFVPIVVLLTSNNYAAEKLNLEFRPKPGQKHRMQVMMENKIEQTLGGKKYNINHLKVTGLEFDIIEVDANDISLIKVTYQALREKTESTHGDFEYDSKKPCTAADNPLAQMYTAMMGQSFTMKVTPEGKIIELKGLDEMFSQMAEKMMVAEDELISKAPISTCKAKKESKCTVASENQAEISAEERAKKRIEKLNRSYGSRDKRKKVLKEMIKKDPITAEMQIMKMVRNVITVFTNRPVGIGDSWEAKVMPPYFPLSEIGVTYILKGDNKEQVDVDVSSKIIDLNDVSDSNRKDSTPPMKMTGLYQGTLRIDKASGWLIGKKVEMRLSGQVTQQGMTVPMSIESIVTVAPTENIATH